MVHNDVTYGRMASKIVKKYVTYGRMASKIVKKFNGFGNANRITVGSFIATTLSAEKLDNSFWHLTAA